MAPLPQTDAPRVPLPTSPEPYDSALAQLQAAVADLNASADTARIYNNVLVGIVAALVLAMLLLAVAVLRCQHQERKERPWQGFFPWGKDEHVNVEPAAACDLPDGNASDPFEVITRTRTICKADTVLDVHEPSEPSAGAPAVDAAPAPSLGKGDTSEKAAADDSANSIAGDGSTAADKDSAIVEEPVIAKTTESTPA